MTNLLHKAAWFAAGLLTLQATAALADGMKPGEQYQGMVVACATQEEAETLQGLVVSGDMNNVTAYLQAEDNSCAVGPSRFVVVEQVSPAKTDGKGNTWKIVQIAIAGEADAYLLTTANLMVSDNT
jgi:hypothetical protein